MPNDNAPTPPPPAASVNDVLPSSLDAFIGQQSVINAVKVAIQASENTGSPFPSALLCGPPGTGKSQLVQIIATEMGVELHETLAQTITSTGDLQALLLAAQDGEIVFLDEADELSADFQVLLYRAVAERKLFLPRGNSMRTARALPLANFTLILATNHESRLAPPLVQRLKLHCRFEFYSEQEIKVLVRQRSSILGWPCDDAIHSLIAQRSRGTPRVALRILESARRVAMAENDQVITTRHLQRACGIDGIDDRGLDRTEQTYLRLLDGATGPVRLSLLADRLGLPSRTLAGCIEPFLVRIGFITRSEDGRLLTEVGARHLKDRVDQLNA